MNAAPGSLSCLPAFLGKLKEQKKAGAGVDLKVLQQAFESFPFLFGCLKTVLNDKQALSIEEKFELIDLGLNKQYYCRQLWETYIDFATECDINGIHGEDVLTQLYKAYIMLGNYTSVAFITQYFEYIRDKHDSTMLVKEINKLLKQKLYTPYFSEIIQKLNNICNGAQQVISFESFENYQENCQNSQLLQPYYSVLGKRNFYSPEKMQNDQIKAINVLIVFYAEHKQFQYLIHLFYIGLQYQQIAFKIYYILQIYQQEYKSQNNTLNEEQNEECEEFNEDEPRNINKFKIYQDITNFLDNNKQYVQDLIQDHSLKLAILLNSTQELHEIASLTEMYRYIQFNNYKRIISQSLYSQQQIIDKILSFNCFDNSSAYLIQLVVDWKQQICTYQQLDYIYELILQFQFKNADPLLIIYLDCFIYIRLTEILNNYITLDAQIRQIQLNNQQYYQILAKYLLDKAPHLYILFIPN